MCLSLGGGDVSVPWCPLVVVMTLLGLSSEFHIIGHYILFHRLQSLCGISGTVLSWLESSLTSKVGLKL